MKPTESEKVDLRELYPYLTDDDHETNLELVTKMESAKPGGSTPLLRLLVNAFRAGRKHERLEMGLGVH